MSDDVAVTSLRETGLNDDLGRIESELARITNNLSRIARLLEDGVTILNDVAVTSFRETGLNDDLGHEAGRE